MTATSRAQATGPMGMVASRSVNMVAGDKWPTGDPYLQRQNEPSVAASTRNPQHLLAGANDYRTVDMPGLPSETGDAWLGIFKSFDGGDRWQTTLLPGYPQDTSAEGMASPIKGFQAGADPVVRPGTNGLLYYAGLAFNRGENQPSAVFMSRFIDNNNTENGDPIKYLGTSIIDKSTGADFIDKPWMAVDVPRTGAKSCRIVVSQPPPAEMPKGVAWGKYSGWKKSEDKRREREREDTKRGKKPQPKPSKDPRLVAQSIEAGRIYVAYSRIKTIGTTIESRIMFSQSDDCGVSWTRPVQLSNPADKVNQGATVAVDPKSGAVYVAWRQFGMTVTDTDSVMVAKMGAPGRGFDAANRVRKFNAHRPTERLRRMIAEHQGGDADQVAEIQPFDQGTAEDRIRTNAYPTMAIDDDGRAYVAWTERGFGKARPNPIDPATGQPKPEGDARVVISTSRNGAAWTAPQAVDAGNGAALGTPGADLPGHQLMPSITFAAGKLVVVYYDLREDVSRVFGPFIDEGDAIATARRRHTIDIRAAYALKGDQPVFGPSQQVSSYLQGNLKGETGAAAVRNLQANAPLLPLFKLGTVPFLGDYIDIAPSPAFVQNAKGVWGYNTTAQAAPVFHVVWTDNRDVQKPADGDWTHYTPVGAPGSPGRLDASAGTCVAGQAGMRNQNIYSARLTWGLVAGSPGNTKPLDPTMPRGFVVFAQNTTTATKTFRFSIPSQPVGGFASFTQAPVAGTAYPLLSLDVSVAPKSMVTRTVFVTSSDPKAQVPVDVREVTAPNQSIVAGGLSSRVVLNPDISNPEISNPEISNPEISNPEISNAEVYNPEISNPEISNPEISNPEISNPEISNPEISNIVIANPEISNPEISNPEISNPEISNPEISNPEISNPEISNGAITDVTWTIVNTGNTTTSFNVNLFLANAALKLAGPGGTGVSSGIKTQLVIHKAYTTPIALGCSLKQEPHTVLVANILFPKFYEPSETPQFDPANADVTNTTLWLEPGGEGKITLRIVDPNPRDGITIDPVHDVTPVITAEPKNTPDIGTPVTPPSTTPPAMPSTSIAFTVQPTNTAVNGIIAPISVHAQTVVGLVTSPLPNTQVTLAIAINPSGGHLSGTLTKLTDAAGNVTFNDISIERAGVGYRLSASAAASGAVPDLSVPFDIGAVAPPAVAWSAGGSGIVSLLDNGLVGGTPRMTYQNNGVFNGAWTLSNVASAGGPVRLDWEWTGFHSYCAATAQLVAFVNRGGLDVFTAPLVNESDNCVGARNPSAGFAFGGETSLAVQAGDTYGFRLAGSHFDGTFKLEGAFNVVVNGATSADPYTVTNAADGGPGSLRAAMLAANAAPDLNTITFALPGAWVHTIAPQTPLPLVSNPVVINGLSQPGAASMAPMINIDGRYLRNLVSSAVDDQPGTNIGKAPGFEVVSSGVTIRGLSINRFPGPGVFINSGTSNVHVEDSTIGAGPAGVPTWPANNVGVWANYSSNHVITRNVISSAEGAGILLVGGSGTAITANRIGTSVDGLTAMPNLDNGITLYDGTNATVIDGNLISGNGTFGGPNGHGIDLQQSGGLAEVTNTVITNNTIGLDSNGAVLARGATNYALGFGPVQRGNAGSGIHLNRASGTVVGGPGVGNLISGNSRHGIDVSGAAVGAAPRIIGNLIGTNALGTAARGNGARGVNVVGSAAVVGEAGAGRGNIISGNIADGVFANGNTVIENNFIGTNINGTSALGNGLLDDIGDPNDPGCCHTGVFAARLNNIVRGNVVSGNRVAGIRSGDSGPVPWGDVLGVGGNLIEDNKVGTDVTGLLPIPNGEGIGLYHDQSGTVVRRNTVAFNASNGVVLVEGTTLAAIGGANPADANSIHNNGANGVAVGYNAAAGDSGNSILSNVIYGNSGLAIDLGNNGPTANDATDADAGPNVQMNSPVLASAQNAATTTVDFTLDSIAGPFVIQFFRGAVCGNAEQLITSTTVGNGHTVYDLGQLIPVGTFIMATATDAAGNTSELSGCAQVVVAAPPVVITSVSPVNGKSGEGFLVVRGTNLPAGIGDSVAVITSGAGVSNGQVFASPSTPNAVWVRLQGAALGAATIQLTNNAATVVSNAFPITVTAVPGTPVITSVLDAGFNVVAAPVAPGSTIYVAADGIDTTGAVIRFTQGASTWDVAAGAAVSNASIGLAVQATVPAGAAAGAINVSIRQGASAFSAVAGISVSAPPALITSVSPAGQVAAGFGQLFTIRGASLPALSSADILFGQGGNEWPAQYAWSAGATEAIVRLPLGVLSPGAATVRMKNPAGTLYSAPYAITISNTPGAPVLVQVTNGCGAGPAINTVTAGQSISVNAEGIDTTGLTFVWSGPGNTTSTATSTTGANGYVTACTTVPALAAGAWTLQLKTSVGANTSALSNGLAITVTPPVAITSVSPASAAGGEGFVVARGTNLPAGLGDMVAVVTNGVNTANGFAMFAPSSPTAVWVRLPAGFPLGAATLQLKNNAGTQVSNAFPITVQAVPGTPVINAIRDNAENIIVAPVAAGSTILVCADGMDTTGAVVRFTQGANTWDVGGVAMSNSTFGLALQVTVPAGAASGPINVSIRQGASAFSAAVVINIS